MAGAESQWRILVELDRTDSHGALWPGRLSSRISGAERGLRCGRVAQRRLNRQAPFHGGGRRLRRRPFDRCRRRQLHPGSNVVQISKHGSGRAYWSVQGKYYSTEQKLYQQGTLSLNLTRDYFKLSAHHQGWTDRLPARSAQGSRQCRRYLGRAHCGQRLSGEVSADRGSNSGGHRVRAAGGQLQDSRPAANLAVLVYAARVLR